MSGFVKRGGGRRTSGANIESRRKAAMEKVNEGATQTAIAVELGVSRSTLWRDFQKLQARYVEGSREDLATFKRMQYEALMRIEQATLTEEIDPDVANALVKIRASVARLLGLDAPQKHLTARVDASGTAVQYRFLEHAHGLSEDQVAEVFKLMDAMPRRKVTLEGCFPGPPEKELEQ